MAGPRTVTTLAGKTFVLLDPVAIADIIRSPSGPVMRHIIIVGERVKQEAIRIAPVRTGNLRDHIVKRIVDFGAAGPGVVVGVENVPYAIWVHEGSRPHPIDARNVPNLIFFWQKKGRWFVGPHVNHPGNKPNRFLVRALAAAI